MIMMPSIGSTGESVCAESHSDKSHSDKLQPYSALRASCCQPAKVENCRRSLPCYVDDSVRKCIVRQRCAVSGNVLASKDIWCRRNGMAYSRTVHWTAARVGFGTALEVLGTHSVPLDSESRCHRSSDGVLSMQAPSPWAGLHLGESPCNELEGGLHTHTPSTAQVGNNRQRRLRVAAVPDSQVSKV